MLMSSEEWQTDKLYGLESKTAPSLASSKDASNL